MGVYLDGIAARFYRGIGAETQYIGPFARINIFIGQNNSGKSNVLSLLAERLAQVSAGKKAVPLRPTEVHRARETGEFVMAVGRKKEKVIEDVLRESRPDLFRYRYGGNPPATLRSELEKICSNLAIADQVWATSNGTGQNSIYPSPPGTAVAEWTREWQAVWEAVTGSNGGGSSIWIDQTLSFIAQRVLPRLPAINIIPAKRVLGSKGEALVDLSGKGLIDHLAVLQNPDWSNWDVNKEKFRRINDFLRVVTGKPDATLEVPSEKEHLLVHMDNKILPLASLGTGIHEVVLIASFCTIHDECVMCLEEPEIHLHPLLQRKLIWYLTANTNNQYFVATHSAAFIDAPGANIFHVANDGEQTRVMAVLTRKAQRSILDDLGCQASDILQANAIIWVEGPSDRIYVRHWISSFDPELVEGIHYTVMFYGGALVRHLSASDDALNDFIRLRDLNRNTAIIIDSDRDSDLAPLKPHAQRLLEEMSNGEGFVWITAGREIENYVDGVKLQNALKELHPRLFKKAGKVGRYEHAFYFWTADPKGPGRQVTYKHADKVGIANIICREVANLDILDLREKVAALAYMIRRANGIQSGN